jgi:hypothetical protein
MDVMMQRTYARLTHDHPSQGRKRVQYGKPRIANITHYMRPVARCKHEADIGHVQLRLSGLGGLLA